MPTETITQYHGMCTLCRADDKKEILP